ncbi:MAG TPA: cytochrome c1 [Gammaproteobacteria bacterium]|nr:cytochrome c1 [Gammaproteobacteria bacterium]
MRIKNFLLAALLAALPVTGMAVGAAINLLEADPDLSDKASLQRGAKLFVNYCVSCHSASFMRYNRMGQDLGLSDEQVEQNMLFAGDKVVDKMDVAMPAENAARWFGVPPPDLSVIARARGADWLYSYLVTFYEDKDPGRPFGVNNVVFADVAMPHVLWPEQGIQEYVTAERPENVESDHLHALEAAGEDILLHTRLTLSDGSHVEATDRLRVVQAGAMEPGQFRKAARDLVNFLVYMGEPAQLVRYDIGIWVLVFLAVLFVLSYGLYKEYWKDVH